MSVRYRRAIDMPESLRARASRAAAPTIAGTTSAAPAKKKRKPRRDLEHPEQKAFFTRIRWLAKTSPAYALASRRTFAIPNGGGRTKREAGRLKAEGVTSGVSDIFCSLPRGGMHGLYIEMKSLEGYGTKEQREWIEESQSLGYAAAICRGAELALRVWKAYVDGDRIDG